MPERFAIYYAPATDSLLWRLSCSWLGRDPSRRIQERPEIPGVERAILDRAIVSAKRYGFHATVKAPIALRPGTTLDDLDMQLKLFASDNAPVNIGRIELRLIEGFLALVPVPQSRELTDFAGLVVEHFDSFREPPDPTELARRNATNLSDRQKWLLERYGYPYVLEQFQFHMTLTDRLAGDYRDAVIAAARNWFAPVLSAPLMLDRLALFWERDSGTPFQRLEDYELKGTG